jgi:hypothetical protein
MMTLVWTKMTKIIMRMKTPGLQWLRLSGKSVLLLFLYWMAITHGSNQLRAIVRAVQSSPQWRQAWYNEVRITVDNIDDVLISTALMLILNVKTCWSSTHQMCHKLISVICSFIYWHKPPIAGWALDYRAVIDNFVAKNRELHSYELSNEDWTAITLVTKWLKSFRSVTTQMLTMKSPMLSTTHAIFHGLQDDLRQSLANLPNAAPTYLKTAFVKAHWKLSDYYTKLDESPFYIWASCKCLLLSVLIYWLSL